jgi:CubicO group peptidase (beta-lactamase class C family)
MAHTAVAPGRTDADHPLSTAFEYDEAAHAYRATTYEEWCPWGAAGRVFSTADDMLNFAMAHAGATVVDGKPVPARLSDGFRQALRPRTPMPRSKGAMQAFAWVAQPEDPTTHSTMRVKNGGLSGVSSAVVVNPELGIAVVVLTNMEKVGAVERAKQLAGALMQRR